jgi:hypothetical protein
MKWARITGRGVTQPKRIEVEKEEEEEEEEEGGKS